MQVFVRLFCFLLFKSIAWLLSFTCNQHMGLRHKKRIRKRIKMCSVFFFQQKFAKRSSKTLQILQGCISHSSIYLDEYISSGNWQTSQFTALAPFGEGSLFSLPRHRKLWQWNCRHQGKDEQVEKSFSLSKKAYPMHGEQNELPVALTSWYSCK